MNGSCLIASQSKLSSPTWTHEHLYLTIITERACAKCFLYSFLGVDKPPFLRRSILTLTMDVLKTPEWHNVCHNPAKKALHTIPVAFEILSLMLIEILHFFASCLKYSHSFISRYFVWLFNFFPRGFRSALADGALDAIFSTIKCAPVTWAYTNKCVINIMFKAFDLVWLLNQQPRIQLNANVL